MSGIAVLLLLRRYAGIHHDAVLYLGQGLLQRLPEIFSRDLVFAHGAGQEQYTLFPLILGQALRWFEPAGLFLWSTLLLSLAFAAAGWYCLRALLPPGPRYWAWIGTFALPSTYGMVEIFGYGEQFLTPRPIAEALSLTAVGLLTMRRFIPAAAIIATAAVFHPLQALGAALVMLPWLIWQDRRWLNVAWVAFPIFILAWLGIGPFGGLFQKLDPQWLSNLRSFTRQVFVSDWASADWRSLSLDALVLLYAWRTTPRAFGEWCGSALLGLGTGMFASLLLVDLLHLVLPTGLQLWRVHWLAHWLAMAAVAVLLHRDIRAATYARALLLMLVCLLAWMSGQWYWLALACLYAAWPLACTPERVILTRCIGAFSAVGIGLLLVSHVESELMRFSLAHHRLELYSIDRRILAFPALALGIPVLGALAWTRSSRTGRFGLAIAACLSLLAGAARWDVRSPLVLAFENAAFRADIFGSDIPEAAQVFWSGHSLIGPWLVLGRASYFTPHQISGQVFNRALSEDGRMRIERMRPLIEEGMGCDAQTLSAEVRQRCHISDFALELACRRDGTPAPDFLVLSWPQPQLAIGEWTITDSATGQPAVTYRLYRCADSSEVPAQPLPKNTTSGPSGTDLAPRRQTSPPASG